MLVRRSVSLPRRVFGGRPPFGARAFGVPFRGGFRHSGWRHPVGFRGPWQRSAIGRPFVRGSFGRVPFRGPFLHGPVLRGSVLRAAPWLRGPFSSVAPWRRGPFLRSSPWLGRGYGVRYNPGVRYVGARPWFFRQPLPWYPPPLVRRWAAPAYPGVLDAPPIIDAPPLVAPPIFAAAPPFAEPPPEAAEPARAEPGGPDAGPGGDAAPPPDAAAGGAPPGDAGPGADPGAGAAPGAGGDAPAGELPFTVSAAGQRVPIRWDASARELGSPIPPGGGVYIVLRNGKPESVHLTPDFRRDVEERFGAELEAEAAGESEGENYLGRRRYGFRRRGGSRRSFRFGRFGGSRLGRYGRIRLLRSLRRSMLQQGAPQEPEPQEPQEGDDDQDSELL
jgi:hypothetical protein